MKKALKTAKLLLAYWGDLAYILISPACFSVSLGRGTWSIDTFLAPRIMWICIVFCAIAFVHLVVITVRRKKHALRNWLYLIYGLLIAFSMRLHILSLTTNYWREVMILADVILIVTAVLIAIILPLRMMSWVKKWAEKKHSGKTPDVSMEDDFSDDELQDGYLP